MKLTVTEFMSVDGVVQSPGGAEEDPSGGFDLGGWLPPHFDDELGAYMDSVIKRGEALLMGRTTYEIFAGSWGQMTDTDDPIATKFNAVPKYVASTTLDTVDWQGSQLLEGDVAEAVAELKQAEGGELQVHGSAGLARYLTEQGLVDEYNLITFPVVLGEGKRLFGDRSRPTGLKALSHATTATGVRIDVWQADGEPKLGHVSDLGY